MNKRELKIKVVFPSRALNMARQTKLGLINQPIISLTVELALRIGSLCEGFQLATNISKVEIHSPVLCVFSVHLSSDLCEGCRIRKDQFCKERNSKIRSRNNATIRMQVAKNITFDGDFCIAWNAAKRSQNNVVKKLFIINIVKFIAIDNRKQYSCDWNQLWFYHLFMILDDNVNVVKNNKYFFIKQLLLLFSPVGKYQYPCDSEICELKCSLLCF